MLALNVFFFFFACLARFAKVMNIFLSPSFFIQFGSTGLVLCSTVFLLSTVNCDLIDSDEEKR